MGLFGGIGRAFGAMPGMHGLTNTIKKAPGMNKLSGVINRNAPPGMKGFLPQDKPSPMPMQGQVMPGQPLMPQSFEGGMDVGPSPDMLTPNPTGYMQNMQNNNTGITGGGLWDKYRGRLKPRFPF